jgi:hypothetical protein
MTVQTSIDGYRVIAERSGQLAGIEDAVYDREDLPHPNKASVTVYRLVDGLKVSFTASARWSEYAPTGGQAFMWQKMPYLMLGKCAETLALRKAFPNDLSGLYTNEEMAQADNGHVAHETAPQVNNERQIEVKSVDYKHGDPDNLPPSIPADGEVTDEDVVMASLTKTVSESYAKQQVTESYFPPAEPKKVEYVEGVLTMPKAQPIHQGSESIKTCPYCNKEHQGKWANKCVECWKKEQDTGVKLEVRQTKTIVNPAMPPF